MSQAVNELVRAGLIREHSVAPLAQKTHSLGNGIDYWLAAPVAWIPQPGPEHARILGVLITRHDTRGNLVPDAMLAALALEHGLTLCSPDTDFARFTDLRWENPLTGHESKA